jgi:hypothetical protein
MPILTELSEDNARLLRLEAKKLIQAIDEELDGQQDEEHFGDEEERFVDPVTGKMFPPMVDEVDIDEMDRQLDTEVEKERNAYLKEYEDMV